MQISQDRKPNRLINEKSPYLLQHAYNPVDWYPWTNEAFDKAEKENKPIFLSIGYSTCHWCHVMEDESFEDKEVAKLINECFVPIKVDREERPDIDNLYMTVCQMLTGSGGWPLTIIMTPDKKPFFAGTYFPKVSKYGRIGMIDLVTKVKEVWLSKQKEALDSADQILFYLQQLTYNVPGEKLDKSVLEKAYHQLSNNFDEIDGGFGKAPKFPTPHNFLFLLRYWKRTQDKKALFMVEKTLDKMRLGGIYDHIGFGFHRYSTDAKWFLPHFEKMLYDQAMLLLVYLEAFQATRNILYEKTAREIFAFVIEELTSPEGGFYSAYDADSEGKEGKFYLWSCSELRKILTKDEIDFVIKVFNLKEDGNYFEEATREKNGENILYMEKLPKEIALDLSISENEFYMLLDKVKEKILNARKKRIYPHKDDKILTSWNALMIAALAKGSQVLNDNVYISHAQKAVDFIFDKLVLDNKLMHSYREGKPNVLANLDDYSFLIWALLELYEASLQEKYLELALKLNEHVTGHFWDEKNGGFFFISDEAEVLLVRQKDLYDGALPSGNSIAMLNLVRLFKITGNESLSIKAEKLMKAFSITVKEMPTAYTYFLCAVDYLIGPSYEVIIVGDEHDSTTQLMINSIRKEFIPNIVLLLKPKSEPYKLTNIAPYTKNLTCIDGITTAYVCKDFSCNLPICDVNKLLSLL